MGREIWLWIKEKLGLLLSWIGQKVAWLFKRLWEWLRDLSGATWRKVAWITPLAFMVYILIGMAVVYRIDDTPLPTSSVAEGESHLVAVMVTLINREALENSWTPNDPVFLPGWWLDNTPSFQRGIIGALSRTSLELRDQIGRTRGSSAVDADLNLAAGQLAIEPNRWYMDFSTSILPTNTSDYFYREAAKSLARYNGRLGKGEAVFERRSDNLLETLNRIALDIGSNSAALEQYIDEHSGGFAPDLGADDLFYEVKGQVFAYSMVLRALRADFAEVIEAKQLDNLFDNMIASIDSAAKLNPVIIVNGKFGGMIPNHLSEQGLYVQRSRAQMREVTNILLK